MKRTLFNKIEEFITNKDLHTFILSGTSFVGKTYLCVDLFRSYSYDYLYIDIRDDYKFKNYCNTFEERNITIQELLSNYFTLPVDTLKRIPIVLDEVTENNFLFNLLCKYGSTKINPDEELKLFIITGVQSKELIASFIGKAIKTSVLHPFGFDEFLIATGHEWYKDLIEGHVGQKKKLPEMLHREISSLFDTYIVTGGMPQVIAEYINYDSTINTHNMNKNLYTLTCTRTNSIKCKNLLDAIPKNLESASQKYIFTKIHKGATIQQYQNEINSLIDQNIITKTNNITVQNNCTGVNDKNFRLYYENFGYIPINNDNSIKSRISAYVNNTLIFNGNSLSFSSTKGGSNIDFIVNSKKYGLIPIVAKYSHSSRDRALQAFTDAYPSKYTYTISSDNFDYSRISITLPFYSLFALDIN